MTTIRTACLIAGIALGPTMAMAAPGIDADMINKIADEGYNRGQVVSLAAHLTDRIGGRITNSPSMREAEQWTQGMFKKWGLSDVHAEPFVFGRGWYIESAHSRMVAPRNLMLRSIPIAWTPATKGTVTAPVIVAPISLPRDMAEWKGKLAGKIVMISYPEAPKDQTSPAFKRYDEGEIGKLNTYAQPSFDPDNSQEFPWCACRAAKTRCCMARDASTRKAKRWRCLPLKWPPTITAAWPAWPRAVK